ncbi:MAG: molybdenum cofactor biosynthesis protein MoaE [Gammaproteobacteria bacterium]|nr:molybdenum cofactor biosynthesis protein MoaE [Gammaproteobacteria bacterium]
MNVIRIQTDDFDVGAEYDALRQRALGAGAIVQFVGLVRDRYQAGDAEKIDYIELQHYDGMTQRLCEEIVDDAQQRFPFVAATVVHRVGRLSADQQIVLVTVASQHRGNAFNAAQFIMDYLKTRATLWKKEVGSRGEQWVGMKQSDRAAAARWVEPEQIN